jgi:hypothetical protein
VAVGCAAGAYRELAPRCGGEKRTAKVLRALERDGWHVAHDLPSRYGNRDHVVVGAAGAFLLDSKAYEGVVAVDGDSLRVERPDNPRATYELRRLAPGLRAAAAALKAELQESGGWGVWVQVVVVVWSSFPQRVVAGDRVVFVHGNELVQWLRSRPAVHGRERVDALTCSLDTLAPVGLRTRADGPGTRSTIRTLRAGRIPAGSRARTVTANACSSAAVQGSNRVPI